MFPHTCVFVCLNNNTKEMVFLQRLVTSMYVLAVSCYCTSFVSKLQGNFSWVPIPTKLSFSTKSQPLQQSIITLRRRRVHALAAMTEKILINLMPPSHVIQHIRGALKCHPYSFHPISFNWAGGSLTPSCCANSSSYINIARAVPWGPPGASEQRRGRYHERLLFHCGNELKWIYVDEWVDFSIEKGIFLYNAIRQLWCS